MRRFALVYQCGLANVFELHDDGQRVERLLQHAFDACQWYCRGLLVSGHDVRVCHCDIAGDVAVLPWRNGPGERFAAGKRPL